MSTPITEYVEVNVSLQDKAIQTADFGILGLFSKFSLPSGWSSGQRVKSYASLDEVAADFTSATKEYIAASKIFSDRTIDRLKILRADPGDADIATSLNAIAAADPNWYMLVATHRSEADLNAIAAWILGAVPKKVCVLCSEDSGVPNSAVTTDIASDLKALANNRAAYLWHHMGGVELTGINVTIAGGVATAVKTAHGLRVGDPIVLSGNAQSQANGAKTVLSVPDANTFTYDATGATDDAVADVQTAFARFTFPEARWAGYGLSAPVGAEDWAFKTLVGQEPTPTSLLNLAQQRTVRGKNGNIYTEIAGIGCTQLGKMASGRFIDTQIGMDWLETRLAEAIMAHRINAPKIPYTQEGINSLIPDIQGVVDLGVQRGLLGPIATSTSGEVSRIVVPVLEDISPADKAARNLPPMQVTVQLAGSIVTFNLDVTVLI